MSLCCVGTDECREICIIKLERVVVTIQAKVIKSLKIQIYPENV